MGKRQYRVLEASDGVDTQQHFVEVGKLVWGHELWDVLQQKTQAACISRDEKGGNREYRLPQSQEAWATRTLRGGLPRLANRSFFVPGGTLRPKGLTRCLTEVRPVPAACCAHRGRTDAGPKSKEGPLPSVGSHAGGDPFFRVSH